MSLAQGRQLLVETNIHYYMLTYVTFRTITSSVLNILTLVHFLEGDQATCAWWEMVVYIREPTKTTYIGVNVFLKYVV